MNKEPSAKQASLFPDAELSVVYEQPLNERIRNCLRLEHLFLSIESGLQSGSEWHTRDALARMLDICDFMVRTDIKGELIKELERDLSFFSTLRDNPGVNPKALDDTLTAINGVLVKLKPTDYQPGAKLRNDELINQIRQRINIPGGTCNFDVPALHYWLNLEQGQRTGQLQEWMKDLKIVERAAGTILSLIRESSSPKMVTATSGLFQQQMDTATQCQLVRVVMPSNATVFPEISGGKHRFTVRFYEQMKTAVRPVQSSEDVRFELQCCGI